MTYNGSCYKAFAGSDACKALGVRLIRTRPYTPKTNDKAERDIKTSRRNSACAGKFHSWIEAPLNCRSGYTYTTGIDPTATSNYNHPLAA
jgi:transposase InsO family protein